MQMWDGSFRGGTGYAGGWSGSWWVGHTNVTDVTNGYRWICMDVGKFQSSGI